MGFLKVNPLETKDKDPIQIVPISESRFNEKSDPD